MSIWFMFTENGVEKVVTYSFYLNENIVLWKKEKGKLKNSSFDLKDVNMTVRILGVEGELGPHGKNAR